MDLESLSMEQAFRQALNKTNLARGCTAIEVAGNHIPCLVLFAFIIDSTHRHKSSANVRVRRKKKDATGDAQWQAPIVTLWYRNKADVEGPR